MKTHDDRLFLLTLSAACVATTLSSHKSWNMWLVEILLLLVGVFQWRIRFPVASRPASTTRAVLLSIGAVAAAVFTIRDLLQ